MSYIEFLHHLRQVLSFLIFVVITLTWPVCQIWHICFLQILNAPADCMVKQTLEQDLQTILHSIRRLFTEYFRDVSEIQKKRQKIQKKNNCRFSIFPVFVSDPFNPLVSTLGQIGLSMF